MFLQGFPNMWIYFYAVWGYYIHLYVSISNTWLWYIRVMFPLSFQCFIKVQDISFCIILIIIELQISKYNSHSWSTAALKKVIVSTYSCFGFLFSYNQFLPVIPHRGGSTFSGSILLMLAYFRIMYKMMNRNPGAKISEAQFAWKIIKWHITL